MSDSEPEGDQKANSAWTEEEFERLFAAVREYGKDWSKITSFVGTRNESAIKSQAMALKKKFKNIPGAAEIFPLMDLPKQT